MNVVYIIILKNERQLYTNTITSVSRYITKTKQLTIKTY